MRLAILWLRLHLALANVQLDASNMVSWSAGSNICQLPGLLCLGSTPGFKGSFRVEFYTENSKGTICSPCVLRPG